MRAVLLASLAASILATLPPAALQAQSGKVPKRPNLEAGADTNFAPAYYEFGMREIERDPQKAADAFYWATRLDPAWAQASQSGSGSGYELRAGLLRVRHARDRAGSAKGSRRVLLGDTARPCLGASVPIWKRERIRTSRRPTTSSACARSSGIRKRQPTRFTGRHGSTLPGRSRSTPDGSPCCWRT